MADLIFGKYEIQHRLAIGGMGEVFFATQKGTFERPVILKSLLPDLALQEGFIDQFLDEARVAATLNHPNVVSIYEVGLWNGTYYIAMEYIRGRNLSQLIRRAIEQQVLVPAAVAGRIIHDAAIGLDHAHHALDATGASLNIVHRDISPQNIMVREDGVTKVVDFGIAHASNRAASRTATGALKGKLAYMAPEQIIGQTSALVDQFALGVVFWEMLASRRLFKAESDILIARKVMEEPILPPSTYAPEIPPAVENVVMRMLERNTTKRFPSCADAANAIEQAMVGMTPSGASPVTAFMRRLGTEDLTVKVKTGSHSPNNFVISLKQNIEGSVPVEVDLSTRTPIGLKPVTNGSRSLVATPIIEAVLASEPEKKKKKTGLVLGLGTALAAMVVMFVICARGPTPVPTPLQDPVVEADPAPVKLPVNPVEPPPTEVPDAAVAIVEPVKPAKLRIETQPAGAQVRLDGRPLGPSPQVAEVVGDAVHYLQFEKSGYRRSELQVTAGPGELKDVSLKLVPIDRPGPVAGNPIAPSPAEPGFLTLNTTPWTKVNIDGDPFGVVPLSKKRLASGKHTLELINEGANIRVTRVVEILPNKLTKLSLTLP